MKLWSRHVFYQILNGSADAIVGNWKGSFPIPEESFEARMQSLEGEEKAAFVRLMRKILHWMPEERPSLTDISLDEFFRQPWEDAASKTDREVDV